MSKDIQSVIDKAIAKAKAQSKTVPVQRADDKEEVKAFFRALADRDTAKLKEISSVVAKAQSIGTDADGGYLVPTTLANMVAKKLHDISEIRQNSTVISNMPAKLDLPTEDALPTVYWVDEGVAITESKATFGLASLVPHKLAGLDSFTREVLADASINEGVMNYVMDRFAIALAQAEAEAFVDGDGSDRPYGFRDSVITPATVAQAGANLVADDIKALYYLLNKSNRDRAVFVINDTVRSFVDSLKDDNGRYLWQDNIAQGTGATLLGRPVIFSPDVPDTEIWFNNMENYIIGDRLGLTVDTGTNGTDFAQDKISMRIVKRVAGIPIHEKSFAKLTGVVAPAVAKVSTSAKSAK